MRLWFLQLLAACEARAQAEVHNVNFDPNC